MKIGLLDLGYTESFFVQRELECIEGSINFVTFISLDECLKSIVENKIDGCITTMDIPEYADNLDWFSFSLYEDYPYDTAFLGRASNIVIASPHAQKESLEKYSSNRILKISDENSNFNNIISKLNNGRVYAFIVPGKLAHYLEIEYSDVLGTLMKDDISLKNNIPEKMFNVIFKENNKNILKLIPYFIKTVTFIGAGTGDANLCTVAGIEALKSADICLHDSLLDYSLLDYVSKNARIINVGKRYHKHSAEQPQINKLIVEYAKKGLRVVRLKSGDPSIFGRLAEEINYIEKFHIPYKVIPGLSSLNAMSAHTGIVLTRRGVNRGFCVMSPIKHGGGFAPIDSEARKKLPMVFFMGVRVVDKISKDLVKEGFAPQTKAAMVFSIGTRDEFIIRGNLDNIKEKIQPYIKKEHTPPGLFVVGDITAFEFKDFSLLKQRKMLVAGSRNRVNSIAVRLMDFGASVTLYRHSFVDAGVFYDILDGIDKFNTIAFSEGRVLDSFVKAFIDYFNDITKLPHIFVSSEDVAEHLKSFGITPSNDLNKNDKILYIYSRRDKYFSEMLRKAALTIEEKACHRIKNRADMLNFETAIFLDSESFWDFIETHGAKSINQCSIWIPNNREILSFVGRNSLNFNLIPDDFFRSHSDIRFLFNDLNIVSKESIAI